MEAVKLEVSKRNARIAGSQAGIAEINVECERRNFTAKSARHGRGRIDEVRGERTHCPTGGEIVIHSGGVCEQHREAGRAGNSKLTQVRRFAHRLSLNC
jgi:hypothetical protein